MSSNKEDKSGFNKISLAFKKSPTIENYVKLRRTNPDEVIEVAISSSIEWLYGNEEELLAFDIPPILVASILDATVDDISELSLILLERIIERKKAEKLGGTHLVSRGVVISDTLINFLINMMLDSISWNETYRIHPDLIILLRERIGGEISQWDKEQEISRRRMEVMCVAFDLAAKDEHPSYRKIGEIIGVDATTIMRWFPDREQLKEIMEIARDK